MELRNHELNPCVGHCQVNQLGVCIGCGRTREERFSWYQLSHQQQREILIRISAESLFIDPVN
ncbi:hypothetical protein VISI1226_06164 [Vibrio sinaloensis DSM 21326]|uniref:Fe-S protein n=1 Tax=Vibrio sinaloensis DSM 21326 TaxID=945550 RepID=E8M185_PHOS4|nr:DUF1289 domain-containing protein [Vibrio sinaloensis]EGA72231.1 hypothetical protein VISI1226_06164 [Vibrio sinaloensis DSM 21326]